MTDDDWDELVEAEATARGLFREDNCDQECCPLTGTHSGECAARYVTLLEAERAAR